MNDGASRPKRKRRKKRVERPIDPLTGKPKLSPQRKYFLKQVAAGNCGCCAQPRGDSPYKNWCRRHGALHRTYTERRIYDKHKKRPGAQPFDTPVMTQDDVDRLYPPPPMRSNRFKKRKGMKE